MGSQAVVDPEPKPIRITSFDHIQHNNESQNDKGYPYDFYLYDQEVQDPEIEQNDLAIMLLAPNARIIYHPRYERYGFVIEDKTHGRRHPVPTIESLPLYSGHLKLPIPVGIPRGWRTILPLLCKWIEKHEYDKE